MDKLRSVISRSGVASGCKAVASGAPGVILLLTLAALIAPSSAVARGGYLLDPITGQCGSLVIEGTVYASSSDGAGGFFIGGVFGHVGGLARSNAAHINADGSVSAWNPGPNAPVTAIARFGTTVYLGGTFSSVSGVTRTRLAAVDAQTGALLTWAPTANAQIAAFAQIGTRIFIGGGFTTVNGTGRSNLAALDASSGAFVSFPVYPHSDIYAMAVKDTELFVGGEVIFTNNGDSHIAAFSPTTGLPTRSLPGTNRWVGGLVVDGNVLYVRGAFDLVGSTSRTGIAAIDLTTNAVTAWNPGTGVNGLCVEGDVVYLAGSGMIGGANRMGVARVDRQTAQATSWAPLLTSPTIPTTVLAGSNWILVGGTFGEPYQAPPGILNPLVARLPQFDGPVYEIVMAGDTCFVGGYFARVGTKGAATPWVRRRCLAAIRWSTGEVLDWDPDVSGPVDRILLHENAVLIGGGFNTVNGVTHRGLATIDRSTGVADPWDPAFDGSVFAMTFVEDTLYVGGGFAHAAGVARNAACAFVIPGMTLTAWNPNVSPGPVSALEVVEDRAFLGGNILQVHGLPRRAIAEVDLVAGVPTSWAPVIGGTVSTFLVHDGVLYIGGALSPVEGQGRGYGAAWVISTRELLPWDPKADYTILSLKLYGGGMLVGGEFSNLASQRNVRVGWVDLDGGDVIAPVNVVPEAFVYSVLARDGILVMGGAFNVINGSPDQSHFATTLAPSLPSASVAVPSSALFGVALRGANPGSEPPEIRWTLSRPGQVRIDIVDVVGRRVFQTVLQDAEAGEHSLRPHARLAPGLYFLRVSSLEDFAVEKFIILR